MVRVPVMPLCRTGFSCLFAQGFLFFEPACSSASRSGFRAGMRSGFLGDRTEFLSCQARGVPWKETGAAGWFRCTERRRRATRGPWRPPGMEDQADEPLHVRLGEAGGDGEDERSPRDLLVGPVQPLQAEARCPPGSEHVRVLFISAGLVVRVRQVHVGANRVVVHPEDIGPPALGSLDERPPAGPGFRAAFLGRPATAVAAHLAPRAAAWHGDPGEPVSGLGGLRPGDRNTAGQALARLTEVDGPGEHGRLARQERLRMKKKEEA